MTFEARARLESERRYGALGFQRAFVRGALARHAGRGPEACPYKRRARAVVHWGRTWRAAWLTGWGWAEDFAR